MSQMFWCPAAPVLTDEVRHIFSDLPPDERFYSEMRKGTRFKAILGFAFEAGAWRYEPDLTSVFSRNPGESLDPRFQDVLLSAARSVTDVLEMVLPFQIRDYRIGMNFIRVTCSCDTIGDNSPPFHRDGFKRSLHICVERKNISGGISIVSSDPRGEEVLYEDIILPGELICFDDESLYHMATGIIANYPDQPAYRDMIVVDMID
ncbi:2OG-Fe dioxygenase family protein [Methylobacterium radiodurans]|uniref:2OG-Fe dioxygenase family protein n=1 Tax=Methylobacterium radiodurans TaxID=2202828 RepID=A0A2U8VP89_9HYPH|nr:2OG-Fe dioxygenase family protein [Methylobacterium radiodurans]AWN35360.1 hypothetical protein DK427_06110 [Methylobacterium radiodurans]